MRKTTIAYIKSALRRTWSRSKQRQSALKQARLSYGLYSCGNCGGSHKRKEIEVDHIIPVGKFITFDLFIERLFCDTKGLKVLCKDCHKIKTKMDKKKMSIARNIS